MVIPPDQLDRWTNATGATTSAKATHRHIRDVLESADVFSEEPYCDLHTLLQGSYRNGTLVRGSGDVDILAINENVWHSNSQSLSGRNRRKYDEKWSTPDYGYRQFRHDVAQVLEAEYGSRAVNNSDGPAIKLDSNLASGVRLDADVVPTIRYWYFTNYPQHEEGISFRADSELVFNFPEQHISRGESLNGTTDGEYNRTARLFKNARNKMVEEGISSKSETPSYFIECLLSNVSLDTITCNDLQTRYLRVLEELLDTNSSDFTPQHNVADRQLFGDDPQQWNEADYETTMESFIKLFDDWEEYQ